MVGQACVKLGAGRTDAKDAVDFAAGVWFHKTVGDCVQPGDKVATVYTNVSDDSIRQQAIQMLTDSIEYAPSAAAPPVIVSHRVTAGGKVEACSLPVALQTLQ
ncbi:expressed unknown protein [Seminavis robusta]|uniref:Pyrimidine nucleoside phosphorylase C-terminal domain-containing protein n=1 Tax=Seminavis robusta TaxID=568900 RepID=A0A9N8ET81_9STRA|nr:expressed unknown protein [Seminavis robusta]|eukprot:Sro2049_g312510.1 n/a (103) ;mRNA; f:1375-1683